KEVEKIFGYKVDEWLRNPKLYNDLVYPDDKEEVLLKRSSIQRDKSVGSIEYRITRRDNIVRWVEERISFEKDNQGNVNSINGVIYDITDRKLAAEQIKASLEEKEILLREIHHRVKNNLQIICSLLYLQSRNIINKEAIELFDDARNRIISMSLVHERLYQSHNLSKLTFSDYIKNLTSSLFRTYGITPDFISLKLDLEDISLNIDKAIPCGLILNELITNSIKYGFKNGNGGKENKGEIAISFHSNGNNQINLIISDNGSGIPENVDFRNTKSLGLQLVNRLVEQLDGTIALDRNDGTKFDIKFAVK
ncbi:PAS domain S-box protein, partial [Candidatus Poribacteria bacterium]|nr:PAS domain S-box protein [Candidatus Poribacteria bacterium]